MNLVRISHYQFSHGFLRSGACQENFTDRVEELRRAVQATEKNRQAAVRALAEERQRSLELQVKISRQVYYLHIPIHECC